MIRTATLAFAILTGLSSHAQLSIADSLSLSQIATLLEGLNVSVSNVTTTCHMRAAGEFSGASEIPFPHGIILSTGAVDDAAGANTSGSSGNAWMLPGDADLDSLAQASTYDACVLEFDCVPSGDTLLFNFAFASEEYLEFVGNFNDVFAILLSGPGINGRINAATLPGGVTVSINNVNSTTNPAYYYDNELPPGQYVTYDGFTTGLTAFAEVQPGGTYHFKVAIADAMDQIFDSAVLLEAFSFRSVDMSTRIPENTNASLRLAATTELLNLWMPTTEARVNARILSTTGALVRTFQIEGGLASLPIDVLEPGAYLVQVDGGSARLVGRFVKP
ncbi:MAG: T9SS type A sorting domain-containing protein [Flavobacteriales bacterium]|nr:T9SS type A sorting domain-containing protein [Flavobacteriales bacterium]